MLTTWFFILASLCLLRHPTDADFASYLKQICDRIPIHTTSEQSKGDNGFRIIIDGLPARDVYRPGETYTVIVNGSTEGQRLMGLMVSVTATDKKGNSYVPGSFDTSTDIRVQDLKEDKTCEKSVISHRYLVNKPGVKFLWTAPVPGAGCIHFNATVIEHSDVWYKDEGRLHRVICEEAILQDSANGINNDLPSPPDGCCACGHAMYTLEFQGLWSRNTHPKGFPDEKNSYQLHWSNLVGATHGTDYRIWDYGQYASRGVKEVCEYGSSGSLENEMRDNGEKIRTVIKTNPLWGPEKILESLKAVYTVNKEKHLLSLITMIGPSPDWCLGVSSQSMCLPNCTWRDSLDIDLYPWDAGTDSRPTYLGRKIPTIPPDRIQRISSSYPNDIDSPFYGIEIKPYARLRVTKNKEVCTDDDGKSTSAEISPSTDELVSMMKKNMVMKKKLYLEKCAHTAWSEWLECSNPCGPGQRERRRTLKSPGVKKEMCDIQLTESESCTGTCKDTGKRKKLHDNYVMRHDDERDPNDLCAVTNWSDWSPCSTTCGLGMKERWRRFINTNNPRMDCGIHLMEKDLCRGEIMDCQKAMMMKNFTAICQMNVDEGPCMGNFTRWFYNQTIEKCQQFSYGGCRGNENRFETEKECVDLCADHMADILRKEQMMGKEQMMSKQEMMNRKEMPSKHTEMEKQLLMDKDRMRAEEEMREKQKTMEDDMIRKDILMKQKMEEEAKIAAMEKEKMSQLSQENVTPSEEISEDEEEKMKKMKKLMRQKERKERRMKKKLKRQQQRRLEIKESRNKLSDGPVIDCMVTPWTVWSECSVTCGKGFIMKTREIKVQAQNGGRRCPFKLVKKKKCREKNCPPRKHPRQLLSAAIDCKMSEWEEWSPCSNVCGDKAVQVRQRKRIQSPWHGGRPCPSKKEKRFCNVPMCTDSNVKNPIDSIRKADFFIS